VEPNECPHGFADQEQCEACFVESSWGDEEYRYSWEQYVDDAWSSEDFGLWSEDDYGVGRHELESLFAESDEERLAKIAHMRKILGTIMVVLSKHGRPLRYEIIARMVRESLSFEVSDSRVLWYLRRFTDRFESVSPGVYRTKERGGR
jgi:hypothetical protein